LLVDFFLMSVSGGFFILPLYTLMQARTESGFRSRVVAGNNVLNAIFMVASSVLVMGMHMLEFSQTQTFGFLAVLNLVVAAYIFYRTPEFLQRLRAWVRARLA
jgi:hypothetical protein